MHILLTGGCGFIGSHTADRLVAAGHRVTVLDDLSTGTRAQLAAGATLVVGDVADAALVQPLVAAADAVIHLAAVASVERCTQDWLNAHRTNLTGTVTILDAARAMRTPVVYASSAAVYGNQPVLPLAETATPHPLSAYGLDKYSSERNAAIAWDFHGVPSVGLRFFNVYGPRQDATSPYSGVISRFVADAQAGRPLTFFGDGEQTRDFIYVGDVVTLITQALEHMAGAQIFNGCSGQAISLKQLADQIGTALGHAIATAHGPARIADIRHSLGDPALAQARLGFLAPTTLAEGLAALLADA
ncbi:MAG: NAD-dependent epimerase/dehydratase family protein [Pseudomonadota bacterium]